MIAVGSNLLSKALVFRFEFLGAGINGFVEDHLAIKPILQECYF